MDYSLVKEKLGIELVNVPLNELVENYRKVEEEKIEFVSDFSKKETDKALNLHKALVKIKDDYQLNGLTLLEYHLHQ